MSSPKPKVLYVDDEEDNLVVFRSAFRRYYDVLTAKSAPDALELVKKDDIAMIITDQRMPGMTGIELLQKLPDEPEMMRIILTGFSDIEAVIDAINTGNVYRYITKPWDKQELKITIDKALETLGLKAYNKELVEKLKDANADLEQKVEDRTKEIREQNTQIEQQKVELEKAKAQSDRLLLNILPEEVAEELKEKGYSQARRYEDVTVLFADFVNFTGISDNSPPEMIVHQLDHCFKAFDDIIVAHGLEKIKTIGDAYMCASGVPVQSPNGAVDVIRAAIDMQEFLREYRKTTEGSVLHEVRFGVHTGPVVAGVVGKMKFAYDIWGDTVNIASRMESNSEAGMINVSQRTKDLLEGQFEFDYRGELDVKGKGTMKMYYLRK